MKPADRNVSLYIDLRWEDKKPRIYVAGKPFLYCSFLVASVDVTDPSIQDMTIEDLAEQPGAKQMEGRDVVDEGLLTADEVMFGFASSLEGWVRAKYNTQALHANLSFPLLKELAKAGDAKAKKALQVEIIERISAGHLGAMVVIADTCADVMDDDAWQMLVKDERTWEAIASNISPKGLDVLERHIATYQRGGLWTELARTTLLEMAKNSNASPATLARLPGDMDTLLRFHPRPGVEEQLEFHDDLLLDLALNRSTPAHLLNELASNKSDRTRRAVAGNHKSPRHALKALASDALPIVRAAVANNSHAPGDILGEMFAMETDEGVLETLAGNRGTPHEILDELTRKPDASARIRLAVAGNSSTSSNTLRKLAMVKNAAVRLAVASNTSTPTGVLDLLALDMAPSVALEAKYVKSVRTARKHRG
jgi:hypothetical protein